MPENVIKQRGSLFVLVVHVHEDHIFKLCVLVVGVPEEPIENAHFNLRQGLYSTIYDKCRHD